jgi:esterase/lipase superfamily enzyme
LLAAGHARLAVLLDALGRPDEAAAERGLAADPCAAAGAASGPRGVVVTNALAAAGPDSFTRVKVFYGTDRAPTGSDRPDEFYGADRGVMDYGTVEVTVPRIHKPGAIEAPSLLSFEWSENPERHIIVSRLETMTADALFGDIGATLAERGSDELFVFVHGYNVSFGDAAKRTAQIAYDLNFSGAPVLFSWPSAANSLAYASDEAVVRLSGRRLLRFLDELVARSQGRRIYLLAHSMGNRALADALELMATRRAGAGESGPLFDQVIFAAPDEDAALFAEMLATIRPLAHRLTLYGSAADLALYASRQLHGDEPRAGEGGDALLVADGLDSIDMSGLGDDMLRHSYFAASASALTDVMWLFWRDTPPQQRCGMQPERAARGPFWLFQPERCDGPVLLSALTFAETHGPGALAEIDRILAGLRADPAEAEAVAEWEAIRAVLAGGTIVQ